ncbi:hypothetical protein EV175_005272, partial [Coemansia sp. RSA 1933]
MSDNSPTTAQHSDRAEMSQHSDTAHTNRHRDTSPTNHNNSPAPETKYHRLKDVLWMDMQHRVERTVRIATQNENGPCPLLALANVLALEGHVVLASGGRVSVSDAELVDVLANYLVTREEKEGAGDDVAAALTLLPSLSGGLDVDLRFAHIRDFADAPSLRLFRAFGVDVVHGWVVSEGSAEAQVLEQQCNNSYDGAVDYVLRAESDDAHMVGAWLQRTAAQLTDRGLHQLGTVLPAYHVCVMFRNNHFAVLHRREAGELFLLCTDDGIAADERIVWESLCDVRQAASQFVDSRFNPIQVRAVSVDQWQPADYARQASAPPGGPPAHVDSDFAFALLLQQQEEAASRKAAAQRQANDRLEAASLPATPYRMNPPTSSSTPAS